MNATRCLLAHGMFFSWMAIALGDVHPKYPKAELISLDSKEELIVTLRDFSEDEIARLSVLNEAELNQVFRLHVVARLGSEPSEGTPPVLGKCEWSTAHQTLTFRGKYPLQREVPYHASLFTAGDVQTFDLMMEAQPSTPSTVVQRIYPTRLELPENLLKFYIQFSAPMSFGESYQNIELVDENGAHLEHPFLEVAEELWDPSGMRLTLLLDPARIKRGLVPHDEDGAILYASRNYQLVIKSSWKDASGHVLKSDFVKPFTTTASDYRQPSPRDWKINVPRASSTESLVIDLDESLDHAILQRGIEVFDPANRPLDGKVELALEETRWVFSPATPWKPGTYRLRINDRIEDLAGNSIAKPFEVNSSNDTTTDEPPMTELRFEVTNLD